MDNLMSMFNPEMMKGIMENEEIQKSLSAVNSIMAKALKRGIFKKEHLSRKLSSLSNQIKKN